MTISGLLSCFDELPAYRQLASTVEDQVSSPTLLLPKSARAPLLARLYQERKIPILLIVGRVETAAAWYQSLETWLPEESTLLRFPEPTPLPYDRGPWSERTRLGRLSVLTQLISRQHPLIPPPQFPPIIVTSARAFLQKTIPTRRFLTATRVLRVGQAIDLEKSLTNWTRIGYEFVSVVETPGQFSRRGGILDIFPASGDFPVRIELFGDEIETMRRFDPATQRSLGSGDGSKVD